jgi:hypothetical protein
VSLKFYVLRLEGLEQTKFGIDSNWYLHINTLLHFENVEIFLIVNTILSILSWLSILLCNLNSSPIPEVYLKYYVLMLEGLEQTKFGIDRNWDLHIDSLPHFENVEIFLIVHTSVPILFWHVRLVKTIQFFVTFNTYQYIWLKI